jgi:DNA-directed RNA polymerase subunit RPC12/RpoP
MDRALLEGYLAQGLSLERIGQLVDRDPTTVAYWLRKHGLQATNADRSAPKGGIRRDALEALVARGASLREMADVLGFSVTAVRHWLAKYELRTQRRVRRDLSAAARSAGRHPLDLECAKHGLTEYRWLRDGYRCLRCSSEAVSRRRRRVKQILVDEAGGRCRLCGYARFPGALHFHHLDPGRKVFHLSHGGVTRSLAVCRSEAAKCVLLCANCHAEVEAGVVSVPGRVGAGH